MPRKPVQRPMPGNLPRPRVNPAMRPGMPMRPNIPIMRPQVGQPMMRRPMGGSMGMQGGGLGNLQDKEITISIKPSRNNQRLMR